MEVLTNPSSAFFNEVVIVLKINNLNMIKVLTDSSRILPHANAKRPRVSKL